MRLFSHFSRAPRTQNPTSRPPAPRFSGGGVFSSGSRKRRLLALERLADVAELSKRVAAQLQRLLHLTAPPSHDEEEVHEHDDDEAERHERRDENRGG